MKISIQGILLAFGLVSLHGFSATAVPNDQGQSQQVASQETQIPEELPTKPFICTQEAKQLCISYGPGLYQSLAVARIGPNCEFPELPFEVDLQYCADTPPLTEPIICTLDARIACVLTDDRTYESVELGRMGPNCHFPILQSEVDEEFCTKEVEPGQSTQQEMGWN